MDNYFIDLHCHSTMKPMNNGKCIYEFIQANKSSGNELNPLVRNQLRELSKESQSNFERFVKGDVKAAFIALMPLERKFFQPSVSHPLIEVALPSWKYNDLGAFMSGLTIDTVKSYRNQLAEKLPVNYFADLEKEYDYLRKEESSSDSQSKKFVVAKDYDHLKKIIHEQNAIGIVLTVEGSHSLGEYESADFEIDPNELTSYHRLMDLGKIFSKNIERIKSWDHVPFFITICHHYWNLVAGQAKTFGADKSVLNPGVERIFDQRLGLNAGISKLGLHVVDELLSRENGKRILIDVKHMSLASRRKYYDVIRHRRIKEHDQIPIIASHAAVSGWNSFESAVEHKDNWNVDSDSYLSRWSINLNDDDIREIFKSDGLIGLVLHEDRMLGGAMQKLLRKLKQEEQGKNKTEKLRALYTKIIASNIFHIVNVIHDSSPAYEIEEATHDAWTLLTIGSDFDGMINPFDSYRSSDQLSDLANDLEDFLKTPTDIVVYKNNLETELRSVVLEDLMCGIKPHEIVEMISHKNAETFLSKYFTKSYLIDGVIPNINQPELPEEIPHVLIS